MTKLLKIRFVKFERALAMQILEQVGGFETTNHIKVFGMPEMGVERICLRGFLSARDYEVSVKSFEDNVVRDKYFPKAIKWISEEQFTIKGKLEIGNECEVSDDGKAWIRRIFAGKTAKQLGEPRMLAVACNSFILRRWEYVRPLASCVQPKIDGDVYTWEMEAAE